MTIARNGYITSNVARTRLTKIVGDGHEATRLISGALSANTLEAKGRRQLPDPPSSLIEDSGPRVLRDLSDFDSSMLGDLESIPARFWESASAIDEGKWDMRKGFVLASDAGDTVLYEELRISEKSLSALLDIHRIRLNIEQPKRSRARRADWGDWVVALATLVRDDAIRADMTIAGVLAAVDDRLEDWSLEAAKMAPATLNPVAGRLLTHLASLPKKT